MEHDKIEDDPKYMAKIKAAEKEAEAYVKAHPQWAQKGQDGHCHVFWTAKKRILLEKYHITWKSPVDMNPGVKFD